MSAAHNMTVGVGQDAKPRCLALVDGPCLVIPFERVFAIPKESEIVIFQPDHKRPGFVKKVLVFAPAVLFQLGYCLVCLCQDGFPVRYRAADVSQDFQDILLNADENFGIRLGVNFNMKVRFGQGAFFQLYLGAWLLTGFQALSPSIPFYGQNRVMHNMNAISAYVG